MMVCFFVIQIYCDLFMAPTATTRNVAIAGIFTCIYVFTGQSCHCFGIRARD
jgi:hypothetical protein